MKIKNNSMTNSASNKCTCSAIQQCDMHRKPRERVAHSGNDIKNVEATRNNTQSKERKK